MGVRASVCLMVASGVALAGCVGFEFGSGIGVAAPLAAKKRPNSRPTTKAKKRKPATRPRTGLKKRKKEKKPAHRDNPRPTEPPTPEPPPTEPPVTCANGECGPLLGLTAAHNAVRAAVGVAPLAWDHKLHQHATAWAQQLAENGCHPLSHQQNNTYGENLYWHSHGGDAQSAVAAWAAEKPNYDHQTNNCAQGKICGHYTQVVWAASTRVGCGVASCGQERVWVCEYDPRGNNSTQSPY